MIQAIRHYIRPAKSVRTLPALLLRPIIAEATSLALPTSAQAQVQFNGTRSTVSSDYNQPTGIAVDSGGNVYEIVFGGNQQLKQTLQANGTYVESQTASGLAFPTSIAIDAYGNLFVASAGNNSVYKETLSDGTYTQSTIVSQLNAAPNGIAVDTNNVVYIADTAGNQILVETPSGDSSYTQTTLGTGFSAPAGIAFDYLGNVYIADSGNNRILKETLSGGIFIQSVLTTAVSNPAGTSQLLNESIFFTTNIPSAPVQSISVSGTEYLQPAAALPLISLASGVYNSTQYVAITDSIPGTIVYYTINGTTPTKASAKYTGHVAASTYTIQ